MDRSLFFRSAVLAGSGISMPTVTCHGGSWGERCRGQLAAMEPFAVIKSQSNDRQGIGSMPRVTSLFRSEVAIPIDCCDALVDEGVASGSQLTGQRIERRSTVGQRFTGQTSRVRTPSSPRYRQPEKFTAFVPPKRRFLRFLRF